MNIIYTKNTNGINWETVARLFEAVHWDKRDPNKLEKVFNSSSHVRFAFEDGELVGFGRTVDDGRYYALIVDLIISPLFQGKGIGSTILSDLKDALDGYHFITLTSAVGKEYFYLNQGWERQKTALIWPKSDKQRQDHAKNS